MAAKQGFIEKARKVHGDRYDYSNVEYKGANEKICIICPEHGEFWQTPSSHISGCGCPKCAAKKMSEINKMNTKGFIEKARKVHGDKYDYSKTVYVGTNEYVTIVCPTHGEFKQKASYHLNCLTACPECRKKNISFKRTKSVTDFINEAKRVHGDKYDYSKVEYKGSNIKVCIICPEHGEFWQTPANHLTGCGCKKCGYFIVGDIKRDTKEKFIEKASKVHGNKYNYSKVDYLNNHTKVCIICPEHGEFWQTPANHLSGCGCPKCNNSRNVGELSLFEKIKERYKNENVIYQYKNKKIFGRKTIDIFLENKKIAIEYQGTQHFIPNDFFGGLKSFITTCKRDKQKYEECKKNDIKLFYYTDYTTHLPVNYLGKVYTNFNELCNDIDSNFDYGEIFIDG